MTGPVGTAPDIRTALVDLATVAAGFAVGPDLPRARRALRESIQAANRALATPSDSLPAIDVNDPDAWVNAWIAAGGNWCALTAAMNRNAMRGSRSQRNRDDALDKLEDSNG